MTTRSRMKVKAFMWMTDGQDGSVSAGIVATMEQANEICGSTEEERQKGFFYEDGFVKEITLEVDSEDGLLNSPSMSTDE